MDLALADYPICKIQIDPLTLSLYWVGQRLDDIGDNRVISKTSQEHSVRGIPFAKTVVPGELIGYLLRSYCQSSHVACITPMRAISIKAVMLFLAELNMSYMSSE